jgi:ACS family tartrate transporter-like MFS transporter
LFTGPSDRWINFFWRTPAKTVAERCRRRVTLHLIPYLFFLYVLAYLDRVNVSVAALGMSKPPEEGGLGFGKEIIGKGFGMFFWGYWILEIPSTLIVLKWGARWVFVRILVIWGLTCTLIGGIGTPWMHNVLGWLSDDPETQFYVLRFLLGFAEGGFFPSVIVYLSLWFRPEHRGKAIASFMAAIPLSNVFGAPLSGLVLRVEWFDLPGWRWIFILQGLLPVLAGFTTIFLLPDRPADVHWLPEDEKAGLLGELQREQAETGHGHGAWLGHAGLVLLFTLAYFAMNVAAYGLQAFMPKIIQEFLGASDVWASVLTAGPFALALAGMLFNAWHSDRSQERVWHTAGVMGVFSLGLGLAAVLAAQPILSLVMMTFVMGPCLYAWLPSFWPMPRKLMGATAAASAVGFINMVGNLGGGVGSNIVGSTHSFTLALYILATMPLAAAAIVLAIGHLRRQQLKAIVLENVASEQPEHATSEPSEQRITEQRPLSP